MIQQNVKNEPREDVNQKDEAEKVDYEFGIPPEEIEKIKEKAKLPN